jgi:hypothetical protein
MRLPKGYPGGKKHCRITGFLKCRVRVGVFAAIVVLAILLIGIWSVISANLNEFFELLEKSVAMISIAGYAWNLVCWLRKNHLQS